MCEDMALASLVDWNLETVGSVELMKDLVVSIMQGGVLAISIIAWRGPFPERVSESSIWLEECLTN